MKAFLLILFLVHLFSIPLSAQSADSLKLSVGTKATFATKDYPPFWLASLQFGTIAHQKADITTHVYLTNFHPIKLSKRQKKAADEGGYDFYVCYGGDIYNNNHFQSFLFKEAYAKAGYKSLEIRGGRFVEIIGEVDPSLSSGSFAVSGNALPIPKAGVAVTEYTDVPFTKSYLQFKGLFSHGWLGRTNHVKGSFLHEKSLYVKGKINKLSIHGGLSHFANWGGMHPSGKAPSRFKDYLKVIAGASGDAEDPVYHQGPVDIANAVGNHMIVSDIGTALKLKESSITLYTQTIFEKGKGDSSNINKKDELIGLNIFGKDRLVGLSWESHKQQLLQKVLIEGIFTKDQGGPIIFNGRFNYYNNATYATGWEYQGHLIGTPMFITRRKAAHYDLDSNSTRGWNIVSNRVVGFHFGIQGNINNKLKYRTLFTAVKHYGNYYNDVLFAPLKKQNNLLMEISYRLNSKILLTYGFAQDHGDLAQNTGGRLAVEWSINP